MKKEFKKRFKNEIEIIKSTTSKKMFRLAVTCIQKATIKEGLDIVIYDFVSSNFNRILYITTSKNKRFKI